MQSVRLRAGCAGHLRALHLFSNSQIENSRGAEQTPLDGVRMVYSFDEGGVRWSRCRLPSRSPNLCAASPGGLSRQRDSHGGDEGTPDFGPVPANGKTGLRQILYAGCNTTVALIDDFLVTLRVRMRRLCLQFICILIQALAILGPCHLASDVTNFCCPLPKRSWCLTAALRSWVPIRNHRRFRSKLFVRAYVRLRHSRTALFSQCGSLGLAKSGRAAGSSVKYA